MPWEPNLAIPRDTACEYRPHGLACLDKVSLPNWLLDIRVKAALMLRSSLGLVVSAQRNYRQ